MPAQTNYYSFIHVWNEPIFWDYEYINWITVENQLFGLYTFVGNGIISGWEVQAVSEDEVAALPDDIKNTLIHTSYCMMFKVTAGDGVISVYAAYTPEDVYEAIPILPQSNIYYVYAVATDCLPTKHRAEIYYTTDATYDSTHSATYLATIITYYDPNFGEIYIYRIYDENNRRTTLKNLQGPALEAMSEKFYRHKHIGQPTTEFQVAIADNPSKISLGSEDIEDLTVVASSNIFLIKNKFLLPADSSGNISTSNIKNLPQYEKVDIKLNGIILSANDYYLDNIGGKLYLVNSVKSGDIVQVVKYQNPLSGQIARGPQDDPGSAITVTGDSRFTVDPRYKLPKNRIVDIDASKIVFGTLPLNLIQPISHYGMKRIRESAIVNPRTLTRTKDQSTYYLVPPEDIVLGYDTEILTSFNSKILGNLVSTVRGLYQVNDTDYQDLTKLSFPDDVGRIIKIYDNNIEGDHDGGSQFTETYVLTDEGQVWYTEDSGTTWSQLAIPAYTGIFVNCFTVSTDKVERIIKNYKTWDYYKVYHIGTNMGLFSARFLAAKGTLTGGTEPIITSVIPWVYDFGGQDIEITALQEVITGHSYVTGDFSSYWYDRTLYIGTENGFYIGNKLVSNAGGIIAKDIMWVFNNWALLVLGENNKVYITHTFEHIQTDDGTVAEDYWKHALSEIDEELHISYSFINRTVNKLSQEFGRRKYFIGLNKDIAISNLDVQLQGSIIHNPFLMGKINILSNYGLNNLDAKLILYGSNYGLSSVSSKIKVLSLDNVADQLIRTDAEKEIAEGWDPLDWNIPNKIEKRVLLTCNKTKVGSGGVVDFPVLISGNNMPLDFWAGVQSDGRDLRFTSDNGTTALHHELVSINTSSKTLEVWVKCPFLSSTNDVQIYAYWGNPETVMSTLAFQQATWSNGFVSGWHMNGTSSPLTDMTSTANSIIAHGTLPDEVAGQIGRAQDFNGPGDNFISTNAMNPPAGAYTVSVWVKPDAGGGAIINGADNGSGSFDRSLIAWAGKYTFYVWNWNSYFAISTTTPTNNWTYLVGTIDTTTGSNIYINGLIDGNNPAGTDGYNGYTGTANISIGKDSSPWILGNFSGLMDELRYSNVTRSPEWILTEYNNQLNTSTFWTTGITEDLGVYYCEIATNCMENTQNVTFTDKAFVEYSSMYGSQQQPTNYYVSSYNGIWKSVDGGAKWSRPVFIWDTDVIPYVTRNGEEVESTSGEYHLDHILQTIQFTSQQKTSDNILVEKDFQEYFAINGKWEQSNADLVVYLDGEFSTYPYTYDMTTGKFTFTDKLVKTTDVTFSLVDIGAYITDVGITHHSEILDSFIESSTVVSELADDLSITDNIIKVLDTSNFPIGPHYIKIEDEKIYVNKKDLYTFSIVKQRNNDVAHAKGKNVVWLEIKRQYGIDDYISINTSGQTYNLFSLYVSNLLRGEMAQKRIHEDIYDNVPHYPPVPSGSVVYQGLRQSLIHIGGLDSSDEVASVSTLWNGLDIPSRTDVATPQIISYMLNPDTSSFIIGSDKGIWKFNGVKWSQLSKLGNSAIVHYVVYDSRKGQSQQTFLVAGADNGLWTSSDSGVTWTQSITLYEEQLGYIQGTLSWWSPSKKYEIYGKNDGLAMVVYGWDDGLPESFHSDHFDPVDGKKVYGFYQGIFYRIDEETGQKKTFDSIWVMSEEGLYLCYTGTRTYADGSINPYSALIKGIEPIDPGYRTSTATDTNSGEEVTTVISGTEGDLSQDKRYIKIGVDSSGTDIYEKLKFFGAFQDSRPRTVPLIFLTNDGLRIARNWRWVDPENLSVYLTWEAIPLSKSNASITTSADNDKRIVCNCYATGTDTTINDDSDDVWKKYKCFIGTNQGIYRSYNGCYDLEPCQRIPNVTSIYALVYNSNRLYAGTDNGLWYSSNDADEWQVFSEDVGNVNYISNSTLIAQTFIPEHNEITKVGLYLHAKQ